MDWIKKVNPIAVCANWTVVFLLVFATFGLTSGRAEELQLSQLAPVEDVVTNMLQVRHLVSRAENLSCDVRLEGVVIWVSPTRDQMILQDASGAGTVRMDLNNQPYLLGQHLQIEGTCMIRGGCIVSEPLVFNDGKHASVEKSSSVFLRAGLHPICVKWFNANELFELEVDWASPWIPREPIPDGFIWRKKELALASGTNQWEHGLDYSCYEGEWTRLPDFSELPVMKRGITTNFDLKIRTRDTNVGLAYSGFLNVPRDGNYTFWTKSDDGSQLYIDILPLQMHKLGSVVLPSPRYFASDQSVGEENEGQRIEVEGVVTRINEVLGGACLELTSSTGIKYLKILDIRQGDLDLLLHGRIKCAGIYEGASATDGKGVTSLLVPSIEQISILDVDPAHWVDYPVRSISSLMDKDQLNNKDSIVHISGTIHSNTSTKTIIVEDKTGRIMVQPTQVLPRNGDQVEGLGWRSKVGNKLILRGGFYREKGEETNDNPAMLPLLTQVEQVKSLSLEEASRGYPVRIRGVITAVSDGGCFIQDSEQSIYTLWKGVSLREFPRIGEYWEIGGKSCVSLDPNIAVDNAVYLRPGILPEPLHPTRQDLVSGILDSRYVEIRGIVTESDGEMISLLTRTGPLKIKCQDTGSIPFNGLEGALIRMRGVVSSKVDLTEQKNLENIRLFSSSFNVDERAPSNSFDVPSKTISELLHFDAHADVLKRIRIAGQIVGERNHEYFLMEGAKGARFKTKSIEKLAIGDFIEVVGFPNLEGFSPVLLETLVRRTGWGALPPPTQFLEGIPLGHQLDATLVCVRARLIGVREDFYGKILELQVGIRRCVARLPWENGASLGLVPGSWLELTGVYVEQEGIRSSNPEVNSFELILNSPRDIKVLELPSWWTSSHILGTLSVMMLVICVTLGWVAILHHQVEQRSKQLAIEIEHRKQTEHQRLLELERTRIAQDLHDDLGAQVTQISMLSSMPASGSPVLRNLQTQLDRIFNTSQELLSALYSTVWTVNPENDNLYALGNYICQMADRLCGSAQLRYRLRVQDLPRDVLVSSHTRHNIILAVKESLNNVIKHSKATKVTIQVLFKDMILVIFIQDNGCGFQAATSPAGNGLENMKHRLEDVGGSCHIEGQPGQGTSVYLRMEVRSSNKVDNLEQDPKLLD